MPSVKLNYLETLYKLMSTCSVYHATISLPVITTYLDETPDGYVSVSITIYLQEPVVIVHVTIRQISGKIRSLCCC